MTSSLMQIAASGARAARTALDVTAQNIANASTEGYVRRSLTQTEMAAHGSNTQRGDISLFGVRIANITRNADTYRQAEVRRTGSDLARADAQLSGVTTIQNAIEQAGVYPAINQFEASLSQLASAPTDNSLRAEVLERARTLAQNFNTAHTSLAAAGSQIRFEASDAVAQVNVLATDLAQLNARISGDVDPQSDQTYLLDQRDLILQKLSKFGDLTTSYAADKTVAVQMGGASGPTLVSGNSASPMAMATAADGTISFTIGGIASNLGGGGLAGKAQALTSFASATTRLDTLTASLVTAANTSQSSGVALNGSTGQALFNGSTAATISIALTSGSQLATAPAGAGAGSRDSANLVALQNALSSADPAGQTNLLLFDLSSMVASNTTTRDALYAIAASATTALEAQTGVNLDQEATNLLKYQQAFQASGKVMQVASTLFDTILNIR
jgi:flagellar hook-associated protein 1